MSSSGLITYWGDCMSIKGKITRVLSQLGMITDSTLFKLSGELLSFDNILG